MQLVGAQVLGELLVVEHPHLADRDRVRVVVEHPSDGPVDVVHALVVEPRVVVVEPQHPDVGVLHVRQTRRLCHPVRDVDAEAVHATVHPEPQGLFEVVEHLGVVPVQVRLFGVEQVQVPLPGVAVGLDHPCPRRPAEHRHPVVGRQHAVGTAAVAEDVALTLAAGTGGHPRLKPGVLRAGVVGDQVHRHFDAALVRPGDHPVQRVEPTEQRVDIAGVGDVIAVVGHRRHGDRVQPDRVDPELLEVVEPGRDTVEVADAVAVAVGKRAWIHLVEHCT